MVLLEKEFKKSGVVYKELTRLSNPMIRIYERFIDGEKCGLTVAKIKIAKESVTKFGEVEVTYPEGEKFPAPEQWGTMAWDYPDNIELAGAKAEELVKEEVK